MIIRIYKKGDREECTNYQRLSLLRLPGNVYAKRLERKCREIVKLKLEDGQCGFHPDRSTTNQTFTLSQSFEKSSKYVKDIFACFVDLEKKHDRVPRDKFWRVLQEINNIDGHLLMAITLLYRQLEVCVRVNDRQSKSFHVGVGLQQRCILSPLLFIIRMNWMNGRIWTNYVCVTIGWCKISWLLFPDDLALLASSESGLQHALNGFAAACDIAEWKSALPKIFPKMLYNILCESAMYHWIRWRSSSISETQKKIWTW